jgi:hypothetical protein
MQNLFQVVKQFSWKVWCYELVGIAKLINLSLIHWKPFRFNGNFTINRSLHWQSCQNILDTHLSQLKVSGKIVFPK